MTSRFVVTAFAPYATASDYLMSAISVNIKRRFESWTSNDVLVEPLFDGLKVTITFSNWINVQGDRIKVRDFLVREVLSGQTIYIEGELTVNGVVTEKFPLWGEPIAVAAFNGGITNPECLKLLTSFDYMMSRVGYQHIERLMEADRFNQLVSRLYATE